MIKSIAKLWGGSALRRREALSRQVAERCVESVCQLVSPQVEPMTFSEARGYIRARAARLVRKQARQVINQYPDAELAWVDAVARAATEQLVPLVLRQTGVGVPQVAKQLRLAA